MSLNMPGNREDLRKPREHISGSTITSNSVLFSKPREIRIDYTPVKKERDARPDSRISHISHASSMLQGYGCKCPVALKHFAKYMWILILLIYIFVMPYLISKLYIKVTTSHQKLKTLETLVSKHIRAKSVSPRQIELSGASRQIKDSFHVYGQESKARKELLKRIIAIEKRIKKLSDLEKGICNSTNLDYDKNVDLKNSTSKTRCDLGPRGPPGRPGKSAINGTTGARGLVGAKGEKGDRGIQGLQGEPGINGSCHCKEAESAKKIGAVYTRWGRSQCPEHQKSQLVYNGFVSGSHHNHLGGGSNFLCLPKFPKYSNKTDALSNQHRAFLYPVEYEIYTKIFDTKILGRANYFDAVCAVCRIQERGTVLMIPGLDTCPDGWLKEYRGYLMAPKKELYRAEYICVDHKPELDHSTAGTNREAGYLNFVDTKCDALACGPYQTDLELPCVVCSS